MLAGSRLSAYISGCSRSPFHRSLPSDVRDSCWCWTLAGCNDDGTTLAHRSTHQPDNPPNRTKCRTLFFLPFSH